MPQLLAGTRLAWTSTPASTCCWPPASTQAHRSCAWRVSRAVLCCATLCRAVPCCTVLHCAVSHRAVLCCAVLCCADLGWGGAELCHSSLVGTAHPAFCPLPPLPRCCSPLEQPAAGRSLYMHTLLSSRTQPPPHRLLPCPLLRSLYEQPAAGLCCQGHQRARGHGGCGKRAGEPQ